MGFPVKGMKKPGIAPPGSGTPWFRDLLVSLRSGIESLFGRPPRRFAIDLGSHSVKLVTYTRRFGRVRIEEMRAMAFSERFDYTETSEKRRELLGETLRKLSEPSREQNHARASVTIPSSAAFLRLTKLPLIRGRILRETVEFEIKDKIPLGAEELVWDYMALPERNGHSASVLLSAARKEAVLELMAMTKGMGLRLEAITAGPAVVYEFLRSRLREDETLLVLDLGAHTLDLMVVRKKGFWSRTITAGSYRILRSLEEETGLASDVMEGKMVSGGLGDPELGSLIQRKAEELVGEIERTVTIYRQEAKEIALTGLVAAGGLAEIPGMARFLSERLGIPLREIAFAGKGQAKGAPVAPRFFQAAGLAHAPRIPVNLLTPEEKEKRRLARLKQIFTVSVLAIHLLFLPSLGFVFHEDRLRSREIQALDHETGSLHALRKDIEGVEAGFRPWRALFDETSARLRDQDLMIRLIHELDRILPRAVWLESLRYDESGRKLLIAGKMREKLSSVARLGEAFGLSELFGAVELGEGSVEADGTRRFSCTVEVKPS